MLNIALKVFVNNMSFPVFNEIILNRGKLLIVKNYIIKNCIFLTNIKRKMLSRPQS